MMVTFIAQCEKKALSKTRRVLDAFANRIGNRTWQTVITQEGLDAVRKLLRKTATKNTAVACHWIRGRSRTDLVWVVGNKDKFNEQGIVPVHRTKKDFLHSEWENSWEYLPLIEALTGLAALFHDWGKASYCFQNKLNSKKPLGDPLRHEWVSCLLLNAFVNNADTDEEWLSRLVNIGINEDLMKDILSSNIQKPLEKLPPFASMLAWLILTHHRLPYLDKQESKNWRNESCSSLNQSLKRIQSCWGYENFNSNLKIEDCLHFPEGLVSQSIIWASELKKEAVKAIELKSLVVRAFEKDTWRIVLYHSRLALMLGDHLFSSMAADLSWESKLNIYANTDSMTKEKKQKLDEHLCGVARQSAKISKRLPAFECNLPFTDSVKTLKEKSKKEFEWQDQIVMQIAEWREIELKKKNKNHFGFFTINMASTGCGKTFANAKIMRSLSPDAKSLRYILGLGLRTLTLQTGDEYKQRIGLNDSELAVLIGSKAIMDLHKMRDGVDSEKETEEDFGSESAESLLDFELNYNNDIPDEILTTLFTSDKEKKFLYAPVLACTIDHIMAATETTRGGRYILPCLRLMSSDLVIDEIDDFDGTDMIAISRLIYLAGMLGRKVMLSSATIPPDLALGYFHAYQQGWALFARSRSLTENIGCAWVDEFGAKVENVIKSATIQEESSFYYHHKNFIDKRVNNLSKQIAKRKAEIIAISAQNGQPSQSIQNNFFETIQTTVIKKHIEHHLNDPYTKKKVSFGVVRIANISPCVALAEYLMNAEWPKDIEVKVMAYHSQQVLLMRSVQEKHLDEVLKRKDPLTVFNHPHIKHQLSTASAANVIYILVATPVEEIGRDHDFDWAVVEPSSYRSIIQLAGRVLRHRVLEPKSPNMALMQYNIKGLEQLNEINKKRNAVFCNPGYEGGALVLQSHKLNDVLNEESINNCINAAPRIFKPAILEPCRYLTDLEHQAIADVLTDFKAKGPETVEGWINQCWWLTALPQQLNRFRDSRPTQLLFLMPEDSGNSKTKFVFMERNEKGSFSKVEIMQNISHKNESVSENRIWLYRDYLSILQTVAESFGIDIEKAASRFGEISIPLNEDGSKKFCYSPQVGLVEI
jgi:CRISPR-associated endonuclease/helicase Cas3